MSHSKELSNSIHQDGKALREIDWSRPLEDVKKEFVKACYWLPSEIASNLVELTYKDNIEKANKKDTVIEVPKEKLTVTTPTKKPALINKTKTKFESMGPDEREEEKST